MLDPHRGATLMDDVPDRQDQAASEVSSPGGLFVLEATQSAPHAIHRVRPHGMRPGGTRRAHLISSLVAGPAAAGLLVLGALNLPQGIIAWVLAALVGGWAWLSLGALKAHQTLGGLEEIGHLVRGQVVHVTRAPSGCTVRFTYDVEPWSTTDEEPSGDARTWTIAVTGLSLWEAGRYQEEMRVAILLDPTRPGEGVLYPPPAGGAPLDVLGDCVAWLIQRFAVSSAPAPRRHEESGEQSVPEEALASGTNQAVQTPPTDHD